MAKRVTKTFKMAKPQDLLNWVWNALGDAWTIHVDDQTTLTVDKQHRTTRIEFTLWVFNGSWHFSESVSAGTLTDVARKFRDVIYPKIQAEWDRRNPPPQQLPPTKQRVIECHQRKLETQTTIPFA